MAKTMPTTIEAPVVTNALELQFPLDVNGFTSMFKKEGTRAVGRIAGDAPKLEVFLATLEVIRVYAINKFDVQRTMQEDVLADVVAREVEAADRLRRDSEAHYTRMKQDIAEMQGKIDAHEGAPVETAPGEPDTGMDATLATTPAEPEPAPVEPAVEVVE